MHLVHTKTTCKYTYKNMNKQHATFDHQFLNDADLTLHIESALTLINSVFLVSGYIKDKVVVAIDRKCINSVGT